MRSYNDFSNLEVLVLLKLSHYGKAIIHSANLLSPRNGYTGYRIFKVRLRSAGNPSAILLHSLKVGCNLGILHVNVSSTNGCLTIWLSFKCSRRCGRKHSNDPIIVDIESLALFGKSKLDMWVSIVAEPVLKV